MDNSELVQQFKNAMRVLHDLCEGNIAQRECKTCHYYECKTCPYYAMCYMIDDIPANWNVDKEGK